MTVYLCASTYTNYKTKYEFCSEINIQQGFMQEQKEMLLLTSLISTHPPLQESKLLICRLGRHFSQATISSSILHDTHARIEEFQSPLGS